MDLSPPPPASQGLGAAPESGGTPCRHPGERRPCPAERCSGGRPLLLLWRPHAGFPLLLSRSFLEEPCGELEYRCHSTRRHVPSLLWGPPSRPSSVWQRRRCGKAGAGTAAGRVGAHGPRGPSVRVCGCSKPCTRERAHRRDTAGSPGPGPGAGSAHTVAACAQSHVLRAGLPGVALLPGV